MLKNSNEM